MLDEPTTQTAGAAILRRVAVERSQQSGQKIPWRGWLFRNLSVPASALLSASPL